jgi:hypothetical protein
MENECGRKKEEMEIKRRSGEVKKLEIRISNYELRITNYRESSNHRIDKLIVHCALSIIHYFF